MNASDGAESGSSSPEYFASETPRVAAANACAGAANLLADFSNFLHGTAEPDDRFFELADSLLKASDAFTRHLVLLSTGLRVHPSHDGSSHSSVAPASLIDSATRSAASTANAPEGTAGPRRDDLELSLSSGAPSGVIGLDLPIKPYTRESVPADAASTSRVGEGAADDGWDFLDLLLKDLKSFDNRIKQLAERVELLAADLGHEGTSSRVGAGAVTPASAETVEGPSDTAGGVVSSPSSAVSDTGTSLLGVRMALVEGFREVISASRALDRLAVARPPDPAAIERSEGAFWALVEGIADDAFRAKVARHDAREARS